MIPLADLGLPMVLVTVPAMLIALLPIAAIEAFVLRRKLGTDNREAWRAAVFANLSSTLIGIPLTWAILVVCQLCAVGGESRLQTPLDRVASVTLQSPWLTAGEHEVGWMIPAASLTLLIPFYLGSVCIEGWVLRRRWKGLYEEKRLFRAVALANLASYVFLACVYLALLYYGLRWRS